MPTGRSAEHPVRSRPPARSPSPPLPAVSVTSNATTVSRVSGASTYYNATTDFGADFGSSRNQPYLNISTAAGQTASTTTLTFAGDQPAGWGFALGDIDADWVFVNAWADVARTVPLTITELGFQSAQNFCVGSPRPSACSTPGLLFESPVWVTAPENFDGVNYVASTLRGNTLRSPSVTTLDSAGAYGWFEPTVQVRVIELLFGARDGFPIYSFTMASPAPKVTISGTVGPTGLPAGSQIALASADGTPVLDTIGAQVTVPVATDGSYVIESEQRPSYLLDPIPPAGFEDPPPFAVVANVALVTAPAIVLTAVPSAPDPVASDPADPELAVSGVDGGAVLWGSVLGFGTLLAGLLTLCLARSRSGRTSSSVM